MTSKGFSVLKAILANFPASVIDSVVAAKDKNIEADFFEEIRKLCSANSIPFYNRTDNYVLNTRYAFAISWRWLINLSEQQELIVFHDSLLPKYRGFTPLVNSLVNGETNVGVTALFASKEYDRGNIIAQKSSTIQYPIKIANAIEINNENYIALALSLTESISTGKELNSVKQKENEATYSLWRDEEDYQITWTDSAETINRFIDAVGFPYKGAYTTLDGEKIRIFDAKIYPDVQIEIRQPGKVIFFEEQLPVVVCGHGLLKLIKAVNDETGENLQPIKKFRCRFK